NQGSRRRRMTQTAKKLPEARMYNFWVVARRSPDVEGEWEAHCLELDVVTQGTSLKHSFQMAVEAVCMTLASDVDAHRDPLERRAPQQFWDELYRFLPTGRPIKMIDAFAAGDKINVLAAQLQFTVAPVAVDVVSAAKHKTPRPCPAPKSKWKLPAAWSQPSAA
ncbi:MAG: hypothetical protein Q8S13_07500, partial [Dehalococcoidia bacterium]|nr:hypothetical protein [Dehalococcoidia bacterium]